MASISSLAGRHAQPSPISRGTQTFALVVVICFSLLASTSMKKFLREDSVPDALNTPQQKYQVNEVANEAHLSLSKFQQSLGCGDMEECLALIEGLTRCLRDEKRKNEMHTDQESHQPKELRAGVIDKKRARALERSSRWNFTSRHNQFKEEFDISPNLVNCNLPLLLFLGGKSNQGKSTLAKALVDQGRVRVVEIDGEFNKYIDQLIEKGKWEKRGAYYSIPPEFKKLVDQGELPGFIQHLADRVRKEMQQMPFDVFVFPAAYLTSGIEKAIHSAIDPNLDALSLVMDRGAVHLNNKMIVDAALRYPPVQSPLFKLKEVEWRDFSAQLGAHNLMTFIQHLYAEHLSSSTRYQCYEELGMDCKNSLSSTKFEKVNVPSLAGKRVLDVGCNSGYFPTHYAIMDPPPREVIGIDLSETYVKQAQCYSAMIMGTSKITSFLQRDFLDLNEPESSYDIISCTSAFHYFTDQQAFMDQAKRLLTEAGSLILEIGMSTKKQGMAFTQKYARNEREIGNEPCFPNIEQLKILSSNFKLISWGPSVKQRSDRLPRMVFHFSLDPAAHTIAFPTYSDVTHEE